MSNHTDTLTTTTSTSARTPAVPPTGERADVLESLRQHRELFLHTVHGLTDEQAAARPTVSALCLGGLVKHVTMVEAKWADFLVHGPANWPTIDWANVDWSNPPAAVVAHLEGFAMQEGETLADVLAGYAEVTARTDELAGTVDMDARWPLPEAPWFEPGATWSARRVFAHILAETAQHAGHADIIRESIDGQQTMA